MNEGFTEPRRAIWAVAEVCWIDAAGQSLRAPATLEDTSPSGACIRVKNPISVGSTLTIKWRREQFSGIARNCRSDGRDFLLGIQRHDATAPPAASASPSEPGEEKTELEQPQPVASVGSAHDSSHHQERNTMESKGLLPKFWRRQPESSSQDRAPSGESAVKAEPPAEAAHARVAELLSYDDIYHAAGILSPRSGYGIHKVLEMLNSDRIRDLAPEIKRASVLMAIEAAGASADDVLQDAMRRQHALDTYEAGQQKQIEEFESRKNKENSQIQAEMERVTAHYAERMQRNQEQVGQEKEALRNWQMAKQHESQRIAEVMSLCMREPAPVTASAAAARAGAGSSRTMTLGPSLLADTHKKAE